MVLVKFHRAVRERKRGGGGEERERDRSLYFLHHMLLRLNSAFDRVEKLEFRPRHSSAYTWMYLKILVAKFFFTIKIKLKHL